MKIYTLSFVLITALFSTHSFAQTTVKSSNVTTDVNAKEDNSNSAPTNETSINTHSVKFRKKQIVPPVIAPINAAPAAANCADNLGGKGASTYTACEAGKKNR